MSDQILDTFRAQPGSVTVVRPGNIVHNPMTRMEAEHVAADIRERAVRKGITVEVTTQPLDGEPRYSNVIVKHVVDEPPESDMKAESMSWSTQKSDAILDHFTERPGTAATIGSSTMDDNPLTRLEAETIAAAIRERAAERQVRVEVAIRPINGDSAYADLEVTHLANQETSEPGRT